MIRLKNARANRVLRTNLPPSVRVNLPALPGEPDHEGVLDLADYDNFTLQSLRRSLQRVRTAQAAEGKNVPTAAQDANLNRAGVIDALIRRWEEDEIKKPLLQRASELGIWIYNHRDVNSGIVNGFDLRKRINEFGALDLHTTEPGGNLGIEDLMWARKLAIDDDLCTNVLNFLRYEIEQANTRCGRKLRLVIEKDGRVKNPSYKIAAANPNIQATIDHHPAITFRQHSVKGDGNCLYRAIARSHWGDENQWRRVRHDAQRIFTWGTLGRFGVHGHQHEHADLHFDQQNWVALNRVHLYADLERQSRSDNSPGLWEQLFWENTWCSDEMLQLLADAYDMEILVFSPGIINAQGGVDWQLRMVRGNQQARHQICLAHISNHWNSLSLTGTGNHHHNRIPGHYLYNVVRHPLVNGQPTRPAPYAPTGADDARLPIHNAHHNDVDLILRHSQWCANVTNLHIDAHYWVTMDPGQVDIGGLTRTMGYANDNIVKFVGSKKHEYTPNDSKIRKNPHRRVKKRSRYAK